MRKAGIALLGTLVAFAVACSGNPPSTAGSTAGTTKACQCQAAGKACDCCSKKAESGAKSCEGCGDCKTTGRPCADCMKAMLACKDAEECKKACEKMCDTCRKVCEAIQKGACPGCDMKMASDMKRCQMCGACPHCCKCAH